MTIQRTPIVLALTAWFVTFASWSQPNTPPQAGDAFGNFAGGPSVFIQNQGQWADSSVRYALDGLGANVGLTDRGPRFQLFRQTHSPVMHQFALVFDGAAQVAPVGLDMSGRTFSFMSSGAQIRTGVSSYNSIWYEDLWPGISLELTGTRTGVKYNFHLDPGSDPTSIRLRYDNVAALSLNQDGSLRIDPGSGWAPITDCTPYIYQEVGGQKRQISGSFVLFDGHTYGFQITGVYDASIPLVIDPEISWTKYYDLVHWTSPFLSIAMDSSGNSYVTGQTYSNGWVSGGGDTSFGGGTDAFVVKIDNAGNHVWSTYLGGTGYEYPRDIALDSAGNCYAVGSTGSTGWVSGGWKTVHSGGQYDGYVVKLNNAGEHLWSSYLGGSEFDDAYGVAVDLAGSCYVTGSTGSSGWVSGGDDWTFNGTDDAYVVKLSSAGAHQWSTYFGTIDRDSGRDIAVDASGVCYMAANTYSQYGWSNTCDGLVVKFTAQGDVAWSTRIGGDYEEDQVASIALDSQGACYVAGFTKCDGWVSGGGQTQYAGGLYDGFVAKYDSSGLHQWSTFIGGAAEDALRAIAVDANRNCYIAGYTASTGIASGIDATYNGGAFDAFVGKLDQNGTTLWSTYLGDAGDENATGIAVDTSANCYVTGICAQNTQAFVAKIAASAPTGSVQVNITPAEAVTAGAKWRRLGTTAWLDSGQTESNVSQGEWLVEFKDVSLWIPPARLVVSVASGSTAQADAAYTPPTAPPAPVVAGTSPTDDSTPTWTWTSGGGDGVGLFRYQLDGEGGQWAETSALAYTPASPLTDGPHVLYVQEQGPFGNWSASGTFTILIDTQEPIILVSEPSVPITEHGPVTWTLTYIGAASITLAEDDVVLLTDGTANGDVTVTGEGDTRIVTVSNITGYGTLYFVTDAATAVDDHGNSASEGIAQTPVLVVDMAADADHDGVPNGLEGWEDPDNDTIPNYLDPDSDNDGVDDLSEHSHGTDPYDPSSMPNLPLNVWPLILALVAVGALVVPKRAVKQ